jgi:glycosyltransferase involved in cell wall biosynthesis
MKISVCMATYNGAKYVAVQLASILSQLGVDDEIVIVDDASTDNTVEIIGGFADPRIRLHKNQNNLGAAQTFNRALHLIEGDLVFLSDQDDRWYASKVETIKTIFETNDVDLVVHDARVITGKLVVSESLFSLCNSTPNVFRNIVSSTHTGCCMVFHRRVLNGVLPIPIRKGIFHDSWIGLMSGLLGRKKLFLDMPLIDYRRHDKNVSTMRTRRLSEILPERIILISSLFFSMCRYGILKIFKKI